MRNQHGRAAGQDVGFQQESWGQHSTDWDTLLYRESYARSHTRRHLALHGTCSGLLFDLCYLVFLQPCTQHNLTLWRPLVNISSLQNPILKCLSGESFSLIWLSASFTITLTVCLASCSRCVFTSLTVQSFAKSLVSCFNAVNKYSLSAARNWGHNCWATECLQLAGREKYETITRICNYWVWNSVELKEYMTPGLSHRPTICLDVLG